MRTNETAWQLPPQFASAGAGAGATSTNSDITDDARVDGGAASLSSNPGVGAAQFKAAHLTHSASEQESTVAL